MNDWSVNFVRAKASLELLGAALIDRKYDAAKAAALDARQELAMVMDWIESRPNAPILP
jgi:hypothetical protein